MQSIPLAVSVERDDEDIAAQKKIDVALGVFSGGRMPAQFDAEDAQLRQAEQKVAQLRAEALQHLAVEQRGDIFVRSRKGFQRRQRMGGIGQDDLRHANSRRPAFGLTQDRLDAGQSDVLFQVGTEQFAGFSCIEAQVGEPDLTNQPFELGAAEIDRKISGAGPHEADRGGRAKNQCVEKSTQRLVDTTVEIVDENCCRSGKAGDDADHFIHTTLDGFVTA